MINITNPTDLFIWIGSMLTILLIAYIFSPNHVEDGIESAVFPVNDAGFTIRPISSSDPVSKNEAV